MTTRLILSKMNSKLSLQRPLCLAINRAVTYLEDKYHHDSREKFELVEALAGAAARNLSLVEISECLVTDPVRLLEEIDKVRAGDRWEGRHLLQSKRPLHNYSIQYLTPSSESYIDSAPQDALIIAIVTGRFELAKQLLNDGVSVRNKSPAFGIPLEAAAAMGAIEAVQFMLKTLETGPEGSGRGLTGPIMSAVENRHADIAMFLLEHRRPIPPSAEEDPNWFLGSREERFWRALASKASMCQCNRLRSRFRYFPGF